MPAPLVVCLCRLGRWATVLADVAQVGIGCLNHRHMAPSRPDIHPAASLAYLAYGSTALWPHCYTAFSFLPFPLELLKAAVCCMVLLAGSPRLCATSPGLRVGYATLHACLGWAARPLLAAMRPLLLFDAMAPATVAAGAASGATVLTAAAPALISHSPWQLGAAAAVGATVGTVGGSQPAADPDAALCLAYQTPVLLLFGFVASTWVVHRAERRLRRAFLVSCRERCEEETRAAVAAELAAPAPNDLEYLICFALPALCCMPLVAAAA